MIIRDYYYLFISLLRNPLHFASSLLLPGCSRMSSFLSEPSPKPAISPGNAGSCEQRKVFRPVTRYAHGHRDATISSPFSGQSEETRKCARTRLHLHFFVGPSVKPCLRPSTSNARAASVLTVGSPFPNCSSRVRQGTPSSIFLT